MEAPHPAHLIAPPTLTDGVVMVRPWQRRDAPALFEAARESIATVGAWVPGCLGSMTPTNSRKQKSGRS